ncbi:MAG: ABC transporter substrate-binding protein [Acetobacteraceae bacterium]
MQRRSLIIGAAAAAGLGYATRSRAATPAPLQSIDVAMLAPSALLWVHAVAQSNGYYARHGIRVRQARVSSSPVLLEAVASGSAAAGFSLGDVAMRGIDRGAAVVIVGAVLQKSALRLFGGKNIIKAADLDGKNVTAGAVRGGTADLMRYMLMKNGGNPASVHMVSISNSSDRLVALQNGSISGALLLAPFDTLAARDGFHELAFDPDLYVETPVVLNKPWATRHRAEAIALVHALRDAATWIDAPANREGAIAALAGYTRIAKDICEQSYEFIIGVQHAIPASLAVPSAGLENIQKIDVEVNGGKSTWPPFSLSRYYDPSFLEAA